MMRRRTFLSSTLGTALGGAAMAPGHAPGGEVREAGGLLRTPPMVMAPRADGAEVVWAVSRLARGRVEVRAGGQALAAFAADEHGFVPQSARVMRVRLAGLAPGKAYEWRVVCEAVDGEAAVVETPWKALRTLDPMAEEATFCVWNDTHENHETIRRLQQRTPLADFLLWNGDTCNDWHQEEWLIPTLLAPAGIDISEGHPLLVTLGNHDVRGKYAFRIGEHLAMPEGRPYFAFRHGPLAVIALNTGEDKPDDHPSFRGRVASQKHREQQAEWLRGIIARPEMAKAPHKLVFCHIPLRWTEEAGQVDYAGGGYDRFSRCSRDLWHEALVAWGAQVVVSGHTHRPASIPANPHFPYAQLTGGGPRANEACWIEGRAGADGLVIVMRRVDDGREIIREHFPRLG
jgi:hypothetical protein